MASRNFSDIDGLQVGQRRSSQRLEDEKWRMWQNEGGVTELIGDSARLTFVLRTQTLSKYRLGQRTEVVDICSNNGRG